ncbi:MAG: hypothetical protein HKN73_04265 [Gemmatimonadetes bacterium]|nr:hypothetical protein [Gemmatimonadota bacterium]
MPDRKLSEAQARALWERAARLHAEASDRELAPGDAEGAGGDGIDEAQGSEYAVDVVVRSAVEAGIPIEYVERALSEIGQADLDRGKVDQWAESYLGDDTPVLSVRRTIQARPEEVYAAMQRVLPNSPFGLTLAGTDGRPPLEGGTLRFDVPYVLSGFGGSSPHQAMKDIRHWADIKEVRIRLVPGSSDPEVTEVEIWAPLSNTRRVNFWAGIAAGGVLGALFGIIGGAVAAAIVDPVTARQLAAVFTTGATAVGTFSTSRFWWRPMYGIALRRGRRGMERLLDALAVDLQTEGAFTRRVEPGEGGGSDRGGLDQLLSGL